MEGIYVLRIEDALMRLGIRTKIHKIWYRHSNNTKAPTIVLLTGKIYDKRNWDILRDKIFLHTLWRLVQIFKQ
jgi:hypothetical protein